jgi:hypothetical protein
MAYLFAVTEKSVVLCANYFRILILHLTRADLMTGTLKAASHHENGQKHRKCMTTYYSRLKVSGRADAQLAIQFNNGRQYWKEVLKRIIAVIRFLASRGLPLRGDNQTIGSVRNGNYLGCLVNIIHFCANTLKCMVMPERESHHTCLSRFVKNL